MLTAEASTIIISTDGDISPAWPCLSIHIHIHLCIQFMYIEYTARIPKVSVNKVMQGFYINSIVPYSPYKYSYIIVEIHLNMMLVID